MCIPELALSLLGSWSQTLLVPVHVIQSLSTTERERGELSQQ